MKTSVALIITSLAWCSLTQAQDRESMDSTPRLSLGPIVRISDFRHAIKEWPGLRMGLKETDDFSVGAMYLTTIPTRQDPRVGPHPSDMRAATERYQMILAFLSYTVSPSQPISPVITMSFGRGWVTLSNYDGWDKSAYEGSDGFWVAGPELSLQARPWRYLQLSAGGGLMITSGIEKWGFSERDFNSFTGTFSAGISL